MQTLNIFSSLFWSGYVKLLSELTKVGDVSYEQFQGKIISLVSYPSIIRNCFLALVLVERAKLLPDRVWDGSVTVR